MAKDALAGWLAFAEANFIQPPSSFDQLNSRLKPGQMLVPIQVSPEEVQEQIPTVKANLTFPKSLLEHLDQYWKKAHFPSCSAFLLAAGLAAKENHLTPQQD